MWNVLGLLAVGAGGYVIWRQVAKREAREGQPAFAADQPAGNVRDAGPAAMRDPSGRAWTSVDEESDQSFPASDPPGNY